jgi:hypothetical protein
MKSYRRYFACAAIAVGLMSTPLLAQVTPADQTPAPPPSLEDRVAALESPLAIHYKGITLTPGGFLDITGVYRSTNVGSGIGTSFASIPFSNTTAGQESETRISAQNSRLSLKANGKIGQTEVTSYFEGDFLGALAGNGNVTSNSNSFRMRLYFVNVKTGDLEILGGQAWSLMTPNRNGISPMTSDVFYTMDMDTNYQAGLTWTRAAQFRLVYHATPSLAFALALENPDQYLGSAATLPAAYAAYSSQLDTGAATTTPNLIPDIIAKVAFDSNPGGPHVHVEAAGIYREFKVYNAATGTSNTKAGAGAELNFNVDLARQFRLVVNTFYNDGGGRYIGNVNAPDLTIRADGTISPVRSASTVSGFEAPLTPNFTLFGYYGGTYIFKDYSADSSGKLSGYGYAGSPSSQNRVIQEGTIGFNNAFWKNAKIGTLSVIAQYSYLARTPYVVAAGSPLNAKSNMVWLDLRYALP